MSLSPISIKKRTEKIYLPDRRTKNTYVHIVKAIIHNAHLYPEVIDLTDRKLREQLRQLSEAGIIEKSDSAKVSATETYNTTLKTEKWLHKRKYQKLKEIIKLFEPFKPQVGQTFNIGQV